MNPHMYPLLAGYAQQGALPLVHPPPEDSLSGGPPLQPAQQFRLQKIGELETFLPSEVEGRSRLHKKYRRAVNILDGVCVTLGAACAVTSTSVSVYWRAVSDSFSVWP
jgi:glyoxylate carboligase